MTVSKKTTLLAGIALSTLTTVLLTGCSSNESDKAEKSSSPSSSASAPTIDYGKCVDGTLTLLASSAKPGEPVRTEACDSVSIVGSAKEGVTFEVGDVQSLIVEGSGLQVAVGSAAKIIVPGSNNSITHAGESAVEDLGTGNTVTTG